MNQFEKLYYLILENTKPLDVLFDDANTRITAFNQTHNQGENTPRGVVCYGWPQFFDFAEEFKSSPEQIRNLFLDFDMNHLKGEERERHPLTQTKAMQKYETHEKQINVFRLQHPELTLEDMLYYHPSGQGVIEYLIHNKTKLIQKIDQIVIHCKSHYVYDVMKRHLINNGYVNIIRMNAKDLNANGYIL